MFFSWTVFSPTITYMCVNWCSVRYSNRTDPLSGAFRRTRIICFSATSRFGHNRVYTLYCNMSKPSSSKNLRNCVAALRSALVLVGKSKNTATLIILYDIPSLLGGDFWQKKLTRLLYLDTFDKAFNCSLNRMLYHKLLITHYNIII